MVTNSDQVVKTLVNVITNSPQDKTHPDDHNLLPYDMTPGFKPFYKTQMNSLSNYQTPTPIPPPPPPPPPTPLPGFEISTRPLPNTEISLGIYKKTDQYFVESGEYNVYLELNKPQRPSIHCTGKNVGVLVVKWPKGILFSTL